MTNQFLPRLNRLAASIAVVAGGMALVPSAHAAAPAAGSNISNIATATYTDGNGNAKSVTSNQVNTTVLQVSSFTLVADRTANITPNGTASLSHTLTNSGNGTDTFDLTLTQAATGTKGDTFDLNNVQIYIDANNDGVPDNNTPITSVTLAAGQSVSFVVVSTVPVTQQANDKALYDFSATAKFDPTVTAKNTDTVNVVGGATMTLTKSASISSVADNGEITYTLTYKNTGNAVAPFVTIADQLDLSKVDYVKDSARWSASGTTALTDAAGGDPAGIDYRIDTNGNILISVANVAPNATGSVTFKVTAKTTNSAPITNSGSVFVDDDKDPTTTPTGTTPTTSNQTTVTRSQVFTGTVNDSATDTYSDATKNTTDVNKDDIVKASTSQGVAVVFGDNTGSADTGPDSIVVHNTGNATETFNVVVDKSKLPSGSVVELFKSDGITPLTDTNGDGVVDTGPVAAGATFNVVAKVTLPSTFTEIDTAKTTDVLLTITPVNNVNAKDTITLSILEVTKATVDLTNGDKTDQSTGGPTAGSSGQDTGVPVDTKTVAPGVSATFPLSITNSSATPDNFNLSNSALPPGWTVQYYVDANKDGVPDGSAITNSGNIPAGGTVNLIAVVTPPANQAPTTQPQPIVFTATSPASGLTDSMTDQVVVTAKRALSLTADNVGQVAPGGTVTYTHTLLNSGTITEGSSIGSLPFTLTNSVPSGWNATVYVDLNNDGIAQPDELVTSDLAAVLQNFDGNKNSTKGLEAGESVRLIVKVQAPSDATAGVSNSTVLTVHPTLNANTANPSLSNTDLTTVNDGQVRLSKTQALDADCDGKADGTFTANTISAKPGQCVVYQITAANEGNVPVTNIAISDATPAYTTFKNIVGQSPVATNATVGTPVLADGSTGTVTATQASLAPNATAQLQFVVKINQ